MVSSEAVQACDEEGWSVIRAAVSEVDRRLGDRLVSAYAVGSLAHGGFAPAVSDIDLALLTRDLEPDIEQVIEEITAELSATHTLGDRLSVFHVPWDQFTDPPAGARFLPIDRFDLVRYGILVHGSDLRDVYAVAPTGAEIRAHAVNSALRRVSTQQLTDDLHQLSTRGVTVLDTTKLVLWPVRFQHVCDVGEATGNADAVRHYLNLPDAAHRSLAMDALRWRDLTAIPDPEDAVRRISTRIHLLHAEVLRRVSARSGTPRRDELAERAEDLIARV